MCVGMHFSLVDKPKCESPLMLGQSILPATVDNFCQYIACTCATKLLSLLNSCQAYYVQLVGKVYVLVLFITW